MVGGALLCFLYIIHGLVVFFFFVCFFLYIIHGFIIILLKFPSKQLLSYEEFRRKYLLQTNFPEFYGMIARVRKYINDLNLREISELDVGPVRPLPLRAKIQTRGPMVPISLTRDLVFHK